MNQSSVIFGGLFVGFVIYITIRGRLPAYVALFYKAGANTSPVNALGTAAGGGSYTSPSLPTQGVSGSSLGGGSYTSPSGVNYPGIGFTPYSPTLLPLAKSMFGF